MFVCKAFVACEQALHLEIEPERRGVTRAAKDWDAQTPSQSLAALIALHSRVLKWRTYSQAKGFDHTLTRVE